MGTRIGIIGVGAIGSVVGGLLILGGSLVGIPIRITDSLDRPEVTYLSPADGGAELLNVPLRILGAPPDAIRLFTPSGKTREDGLAE